MIYRIAFSAIVTIAASSGSGCGNFVEGFSNALFQEMPTLQRTAPSSTDGVDIELPDFDELFGRIQQVSPLARSVITGSTTGDRKGFASCDEECKFLSPGASCR